MNRIYVPIPAIWPTVGSVKRQLDASAAIDREAEEPKRRRIKRVKKELQDILPGDKQEVSEGGTAKGSATSNKATCSACLEVFPKLAAITCPCDDVYCKACLRQMFVFATKDESVFPPKCCQKEIPLPKRVLSKEERKAFDIAAAEFRTLGRRTYCYNCSKFISAKRIKEGIDEAKCRACRVSTCTRCGKAYHPEDFCDDKEGEKRLLTMLKKHNWSRCGKCQRIVIKNGGCNNMVCLCGNNFCYRCGKSFTSKDPHRSPCTQKVYESLQPSEDSGAIGKSKPRPVPYSEPEDDIDSDLVVV
ncbi:hypothetical protein BJ508DRAFT_324778 [Ascobolus immersus RN42]|uniref:RBR-type E3 ubiquitin transferase n=1 Tax=Ascobolus immersus RN42 TaxID=1160509 RepID=A0A3N4IAU1_ASCIM|nr:hypothetical protein BJ508DRAFT_324778 [Ascobolus immersus RN42]